MMHSGRLLARPHARPQNRLELAPFENTPNRSGARRLVSIGQTPPESVHLVAPQLTSATAVVIHIAAGNGLEQRVSQDFATVLIL